jgi:hypothetical protein
LSLQRRLIPFFEESNNQSSDARKISKRKAGEKTGSATLTGRIQKPTDILQRGKG